MKAKKLFKKILCVAGVILALFALLVAGFLYETEYKIADIDHSVSPDGTYTLLYQSVGEPDFPFGYSHARLVLKSGKETIVSYPFDVANDGAILFEDSWAVRWDATCVRVTISGEEQNDDLYTLYFNGKQAYTRLNTKTGE